MDGLSNKLLTSIAEHCDFSSLKESRLVGHKWHGISTPLVFEHLYVGLFDHSLSKLESLASSQLAKHVKTLTFYCDALPQYERLEWEREVDSKLGHRYHAKNNVDAEWQAYEELLREQRDWQHFREVERFQGCLSKLHNLKDVSAIRTMAGDTDANQWPLWKRLTKRCIVGPDQWKRRHEDSPNPFMEDDADGRASLALLEAMGHRAASGLRPIINLRLQLFCQNFYFSRPMSYEGSTQHVSLAYVDTVKPNIRTAFAHLTDLSLYVETSRDPREAGGILAEFLEFLSFAKQLRSLRLWFDHWEDVRGEFPEEPSHSNDEVDFFPLTTVIWPKIEHLALKINVSTSILLPFLELHSSTLRSLELRHMLVGNVPLLLQGISETLRLDHVFVQGLWHNGPGLPPQEHLEGVANVCLLGYGTDCDRTYENQIKKYLLCQTATMPDLRDDPLVCTKSGYGMNLLDYEPIVVDRR